MPPCIPSRANRPPSLNRRSLTRAVSHDIPQRSYSNNPAGLNRHSTGGSMNHHQSSRSPSNHHSNTGSRRVSDFPPNILSSIVPGIVQPAPRSIPTLRNIPRESRTSQENHYVMEPKETIHRIGRKFATKNNIKFAFNHQIIHSKISKSCKFQKFYFLRSNERPT